MAVDRSLFGVVLAAPFLWEPSSAWHVRALAGIESSSHVLEASIAGPGATVSARPMALLPSSNCEPSWLPTFGGQPGVGTGQVEALTTHDDGSGSGRALYVAGSFFRIGGTFAQRIARWDGSTWTTLDTGVTGLGTGVQALAEFDDGTGSGPALFATGEFTSSGPGHPQCIAKWDGSSWSALGDGLDQTGFALVVHDDGSTGGPALYAGGVFHSAGGALAEGIARWDGTQWSSVGSELSGDVFALAVFDDGLGGGTQLYAAGRFWLAGVSLDPNVAKWDGAQWSPLGSGLSGNVFALAVHDDGLGGGPALHAGGTFQNAGGQPAARVARWDGVSWSAMGSGMNESVVSLHVHDGGSGAPPLLYAGGNFTTAGGLSAHGIAYWNGTGWKPVANGLDPTVTSMASFDDGSGGGPALYAGGNFLGPHEVVVNGLAVLGPDEWLPVGPGLNESVDALEVFDDPSTAGPALYAGGYFTAAGGGMVWHIARWNGALWSPLGEGLNGGVHALEVHDDGSGAGPALYAGGFFTFASGSPASRIARWDGTAWSQLGLGMNYTLRALCTHDDGLGGGPALYAGGQFEMAGGSSARRIAKWDGAQWSPLGAGLSGAVYALAVYDDGTGPELFVGGTFTMAGGQPASTIARWDGAAWHPVGSGFSGGGVEALVVYDDGSAHGPRLFAGGAFTHAGGVPVNHVAVWDGLDWSPLGLGLSDSVYALSVFDDGAGGGPALIAGGEFLFSGGTPTSRVARWDGAQWSALGAGVDDWVSTLAVFDDGAGAGPALFAGGNFLRALDSDDSFLARWGSTPPCGQTGIAYCSGDGSGSACPCGNEHPGAGGCANSTGAGAILLGSGEADVSRDSLVLSAAGVPPSRAALFFQGDNRIDGGNGSAFGDGLRCAGGQVVRLAMSNAEADGTLSYPAAGDAPISAAGHVLAGDTKRYQLWYRDPAGGPCATGFNLSNGYEVVWR